MKLSFAALALISTVATATIDKDNHDLTFVNSENGNLPKESFEDKTSEYVSLAKVFDWNIIVENDLADIPEKFLVEEPIQRSIIGYFSNLINMIIPSRNFENAIPPTSTISESETIKLCGLLGCSEVSLMDFSESFGSLSAVLSLEQTDPIQILTMISEMNNVNLFEQYFMNAFPTIMSESISKEALDKIVHACIKVDSASSLFSLLNSISDSQNCEFKVNGTRAIYFASTNGSAECLKLLVSDAEIKCLEFVWDMDVESSVLGPMNSFGSNPKAATFVVAMIEVIKGNHVKCFQNLLEVSQRIFHNNRFLYVELAAMKDSSVAFPVFEEVFAGKDVDLQIQILYRAFGCSNVALVHFIFPTGEAKVFCSKKILIRAIQTNNYEIFRATFNKFDVSKIDDAILNHAAKSGVENILIDILKVSSNELITNALCNCIQNPSYNNFVRAIVENIDLNADMVAQGLKYSCTSNNPDFVALFLSHDKCELKYVKTIFIYALESNNLDLINHFSEKYSIVDIIGPNNINRVLKYVISKMLWESSKFLINQCFSSSNFGKHTILLEMLKTDQVEIVEFLVKKGTFLYKSDIPVIKNNGMLAYVLKAINDQDVAEAALKSSKKT